MKPQSIEFTETPCSIGKIGNIRKMNKNFHEKLEEYLNMGIIRRVSRNYPKFISPPLSVYHERGECHLAINYSELNKYIKHDPYPMPTVSKTIDKLFGMKWFTRIQLKNGCLNIPLSEESQKYTAFKLKDNSVYAFNVLPCGLKSSNKILQRVLDTIFEKYLKNGTMVIYVDDILIMTKDAASHAVIITEVYELLDLHDIEINLDNSVYCRHSIQYLQHIIEDNKVQPMPDKVSKILRTPKPTNIKELQSFLGSINYFNNYLSMICIYTAELVPLLRSGAQFIWTKEHDDMYKGIIVEMENLDPLYLPDFTESFYISVNATEKTIEGTIYQRVINKHNSTGFSRIVSNVSKMMQKNQMNWSETMKQLYAVVEVIEKFKHYISLEKSKNEHYVSFVHFECPCYNKKTRSHVKSQCSTIKELNQISALTKRSWIEKISQYNIYFLLSTNFPIPCLTNWMNKELEKYIIYI